MSMREYSLRDAGFLIDAEVAAYACLSMDKTTKSVPEAIQVCLDDGTFAEKARAGALPEDYSDVDIVIDFFNALPEDVGTCVDAPRFCGTAVPVLPELAETPQEMEFDDDLLLYIGASKESTLFQAAYSSPEELLEEFKKVMTHCEVELPEDFDWWGHIMTFGGTYYC